MVNWYVCPQVHTSKLINDGVPASRRQGVVVNRAVPRPSPHPPSPQPGYDFSLAMAVTQVRVRAEGLPLHIQIPSSPSTSSFLSLLPKDQEPKSEKKLS